MLFLPADSRVLSDENLALITLEPLPHVLASSIREGFIYNAAAQNIKVYDLKMDLEGIIDLHSSNYRNLNGRDVKIFV